MHVLANSDSFEDQMLKLQARDAVLAEMNVLLSGQKDLEKVVEIIKGSEDELVQKASEAIGYKYPVKIELGREDYPERSYGNLILPSGEYLRLR